MVHVCGPERALLPWAPDLLAADLASGFQWCLPGPLCTGTFPSVTLHGSTWGIRFHLLEGHHRCSSLPPPPQPSFIRFGEGWVPRAHCSVTLNTDSVFSDSSFSQGLTLTLHP